MTKETVFNHIIIDSPNDSCIGIIGDIHSEDELLKRAILFFQKHNIENIYCTGDIVDGHGDINKCCDLLKRNRIKTVLGNHDRWLLQNESRNLPDATSILELNNQSRDFLMGLPLEISIESNTKNYLLCHGLGKNDMNGIKPEYYGYELEVNEELQQLISEKKYDIIINGHTHIKMVKKIDNLIIVNCGTLKSDNNPVIAIMNLKHYSVTFYKYSFSNSTFEFEQEINF